MNFFVARRAFRHEDFSCATKGPRTRRSVRSEGSSDPEQRSRRRAFGPGAAFVAKDLRIWIGVCSEGSSELEQRSRRRALGFGAAWVGKPSGGTVREASGVLFGVPCKGPASRHLMPPFILPDCAPRETSQNPSDSDFTRSLFPICSGH